ncbi:MAG TPA: nucleotidyl transferase AbiEii/AbiGii toxin family protein [Labilithrix sp.]|nr:nucleotidyl transferase AbiEii/AbiGii toxin family protein [Labilithrix sp.]
MASKKTAKRAPNPVTEAAARAAEDLTELGARFALVGGLAVSAWGEPRYTRDVDLAVAVDVDQEAERLVYELSARSYEVVTIIEQTKTNRLATARLRRIEDRSVLIDLLFASSGIEPELAAAAVRIDDVPVSRVGHLLALKVLSESERRLQDRIDIQQLAIIATDEDWRTAEAMVRLIKERGFHRGRALLTRLRRWRRSPSNPGNPSRQTALKTGK